MASETRLACACPASEWDRSRMKVTNHSAANDYIKPESRGGWSFT
jgi:hypothetical protein